MPDERAVTPPQIKSCLNGSRLLAMSIWTEDGTMELATTLGPVALLDKKNPCTGLIPTIKLYAEQ
jgi:hypothetical protein